MKDEENIIKQLLNYYNNSLVKNNLLEVRQLQIDFFNSCINRQDKKYVQSAFINLLVNIQEIFPIKFKEYTNVFPSKCLIVSNHLGIGKLAKIFPKDLSSSNDSFLPNNDSFIFLGFPLFYYLFVKQNCSFNNIKTISIPYESTPISILQNYLSIIPTQKREFREILINSSIDYLLVFPEGGTSGKRNQKGIYSLEDFNEGYLKFSIKLGMKILPIIQYLNKKGEYELIKLEIIENETSLDLKIRMQNEINKYVE
jgi:hypothetical protein